MRPATIEYFERLMILTLMLGLIQSFLGWSDAIRMMPATVVIAIWLVTFGLTIGLTLLVSRKRANWAKWMLIVLFLLGLPGYFSLLQSGFFPPSMVISLLQLLGQIIAIALLFTASAREYLSRSKETANKPNTQVN